MPELDPSKIINLSKNLISKRLFKDKVVGIVIRLSGLFVLLAILGIFYVILDEVYPLLKKAKVNSAQEVFIPLVDKKVDSLSLGYSTEADFNYIWTANGTLYYFSNNDQSKKYQYQIDLKSQKLLSVYKSINKDYFYLTNSSGNLFGVEVSADENKDSFLPTEEITSFDQAVSTLKVYESEKQTIFASIGAKNRENIQLYGVIKGKGLVAKTKAKEIKSVIAGLGKKFSSLEFSVDGKKLFAGTDSGEILIYDLRNLEAPSLITSQVPLENAKVTAMRFLIQGQTLVLGFDNGEVISYFIEELENSFLLKKVHKFTKHTNPVKEIYPSQRNRMFITADTEGGISIHNSTAKQTQYSREKMEGEFYNLAFSPKANEFVTLDGESNIKVWAIDNAYTDVSMKTLFSRVQYEGYSKKAYVWQSSSGSDEFEPKYNLMPLIFGTLKGTLYALLFAVPIAILGALYVSEFMKAKMRAYIKPLIELMAAVPSVVIGFMAGIWLAPSLEDYLVSLLLFPFITFGLILSVLFLYVKFYDRKNMIRKSGTEFTFVFLTVALSVVISIAISRYFENIVFAGSLTKTLLEKFSIIYDQRNSLVVSIAMGYAVIPLIFTLAEDSISAIPKHLREGSLALGATQWQTAIKVVLPAASPGIFSAILLGFGRAIGETMIVLMATGNTPIIDLSPFNGFRALSANIAVELPEATAGGALYRIIFLSAFLLLIFSFFVNTLTEIIRIKLRKKYS